MNSHVILSEESRQVQGRDFGATIYYRILHFVNYRIHDNLLRSE